MRVRPWQNRQGMELNSTHRSGRRRWRKDTCERALLVSRRRCYDPNDHSPFSVVFGLAPAFDDARQESIQRRSGASGLFEVVVDGCGGSIRVRQGTITSSSTIPAIRNIPLACSSTLWRSNRKCSYRSCLILSQHKKCWWAVLEVTSAHVPRRQACPEPFLTQFKRCGARPEYRRCRSLDVEQSKTNRRSSCRLTPHFRPLTSARPTYLKFGRQT